MSRTPFYDQVKSRLIRYARVDTQSSRTSGSVPSTAKQFDLAYMLQDELAAIGAANIFLDEENAFSTAVSPPPCLTDRE